MTFAAKRPGKGSQMWNVWNLAQPGFPALKVRPDRLRASSTRQRLRAP
jgi:hypothetical protein